MMEGHCVEEDLSADILMFRAKNSRLAKRFLEAAKEQTAVPLEIK